MKVFLFVIILCLSLSAAAQDRRALTDFPVMITIQFHALSMPFRELRANFSNPGIGIGTEVFYNREKSFAQQATILWYRNKHAGNGLFIYTQAAWRPGKQEVYGELKTGVGYLYSFRPAVSYQQSQGAWIDKGKKGKGMFAIPTGISVGYNSVFTTYQFVLASGYNKSIPVVPQTFIQAGVRINR